MFPCCPPTTAFNAMGVLIALFGSSPVHCWMQWSEDKFHFNNLNAVGFPDAMICTLWSYGFMLYCIWVYSSMKFLISRLERILYWSPLEKTAPFAFCTFKYFTAKRSKLYCELQHSRCWPLEDDCFSLLAWSLSVCSGTLKGTVYEN